MTWTLREVDDDFIILGSTDAGDIGRALRLLGFDLQVPKVSHISQVFVTIQRDPLTEENSNAKINEPSADAEPESELPF